MKISDYLQKSSALFDENRLLKFVFVVMSGALCFNSLMTYRAVTYQRTILIPPKMTGEVEFVQGKPTEKYIRDISRTIANLVGTYSPSTARENFEALLYYYAPESFPEASKNWYSLASRAEEGLVSSTFYLQNLHFDEKTIELLGQLVQYTGNTPLENTTRSYLVDYRIEDGRFYLLAVKEKGQKGLAEVDTKQEAR
ncbi:TraE/TraK family type IV conjugative transfer system protein [Desulfopila aestuarii]|uniref:Conjugal transfer pilus assembly protein TraE n=1 Tax=Desulfopila aestuarii DSM 18488 TaxID=1121416 RepID=A0A1M7YHE1_9BACT|nr:TraE/TraK family type IV conjugative transfer system protein [Desulfopila aestuarii]SHO52057.1 conjugal transfer pilus assembly protein TraE [Desulfopila aestuarii DSM 18488]